MDILQHIEQLKKHLAELEKLVKEQGLGAQSEDSSGASVDSSRVAQATSAIPATPAAPAMPGASGVQSHGSPVPPGAPVSPLSNLATGTAAMPGYQESSARPTLTESAPGASSTEAPGTPAVSRFQHKPPEPRIPVDWDKLIAAWLPRIFIVVFLVGVLWGFSAAVSSGLISEPVRCLLGVAAAAVMFWQGERQSARARFALGQVLIGGSVAVLLLSLFSAHMLYDLILSVPAFILYVATIAIGLFSSVRHKSQTLMIIMMVAGYLVPFLVDSAEPDLRVFIVYETLFSIAMMIMAHKLSYRLTLYIAYFLLQLPLLITYAFTDSRGFDPYFITSVIVQHAVLLAIYAGHAADRTPFRPVILYTSYALMIMWAHNLYDGRLLYPLLLALTAFFYGAIAFMQHRWKRPYEVYLSIATIGLFFWLSDVMQSGSMEASWVVQGTVALLLGIALRSAMQQITGGVILLLGTIAVLFNPIEDVFSADTLAWTALIASGATLYWMFGRMQAAAGYRPYRRMLAWVTAVLFLICLTMVTEAATKTLNADVRRLILSASWTAYAAGATSFGIIRKVRAARFAGIVFLLAILLKVIFVDLPFLSTAVRAILFIGLGLIGVALSRLFYKRPADPPTDSTEKHS